MKQTLRKCNIFTLLLWISFLCLTVIAFSTAKQLAAMYSSVSLRYESPLTTDTARSVRQYVQQNSENEHIWPTFWSQKNTTLKTNIATQTTECIFYDGNGTLVWPAKFIAGDYPSALDSTGCAVSSQLAWQLWGSYDIIGQPITIQNKQYNVRGVFTDDTPRAMASLGGTTYADGWHNIELGGASDKDPRSDADRFIQKASLPTPTTILNGHGFVSLSKFMILLPLSITLLYSLYQLFKLYKKGKTWQRDLLFFCTLAGIALLLPSLLALLPHWIIPNRWSDFSFWENIGSQISTHLQEWLLMHPYQKDAAACLLLIKQSITFVGITFVIPILWKHNVQHKKADALIQVSL